MVGLTEAVQPYTLNITMKEDSASSMHFTQRRKLAPEARSLVLQANGILNLMQLCMRQQGQLQRLRTLLWLCAFLISLSWHLP